MPIVLKGDPLNLPREKWKTPLLGLLYDAAPIGDDSSITNTHWFSTLVLAYTSILLLAKYCLNPETLTSVNKLFVISTNIPLRPFPALSSLYFSEFPFWKTALS